MSWSADIAISFTKDSRHYDQKGIICLYIPDEYDYMDLLLIELLKESVTPHLGRLGQTDFVLNEK